MTTANPTALRALLIYALVLPLALVMGYLLATPTDDSTLALVGLVLAVLLSPILLKYHHPLLFITWNTTAVAFFLPGRPGMWLPVVFGSLLVSIVQRALVREKSFIHTPSLFWPLVFLGLTVAVTGHFTGGIFGMRVFGSETFGGRRYMNIFGAILGFFAMTCVRIPPQKAVLYLGLFFLPALTNVIGSLIPRLPGVLTYLALFFPISMNDVAGTAWGTGLGGWLGITRLEGLTTACECLFCYFLARYGLRDLFAGRRLSLALGIPALVLLGSLGGFRSFVVLCCLVFLAQFYFEGLFRSRYVIGLVFGLFLAGVLLFNEAERLPLSIQRSVSFLPIPVSQVALQDAEGTAQWRLDMWKRVSPQVPNYLWLGRGLSMDAQTFQMTGTLGQLRKDFDFQSSWLSQDYHNGPLTILIPFGIWGLLGWLWFLTASIRALYLNHLYGDPALQKINTFLLAFFIAKTIFYFTIFGNFYTDIPYFAGLIGLGISLNGGICKPARAPVTAQPVLLLRQPPGCAPTVRQRLTLNGETGCLCPHAPAGAWSELHGPTHPRGLWRRPAPS